MSNKDFLNQFSNEDKKPDSFKEEERVKVVKERKPINVKLLIIILASALLIVGAVLFIIFRPTIVVNNFVGQKTSEVKSWIKQNEIETQGVVFKEEYNFDYDEGVIVSQSIAEGKKVRKKVKIDFVVSLGADPDEKISVPNIGSMTKEEIQKWINDNKLSKTKITTSYSDTVPSGSVVKYEFAKNSSADDFTRSSTLNITISKGPQPAGTVVVPDFVEKHYSEVESWAKTNKIELNKTTSYSDKVEKDLVISQSVNPKKEIKEGEKFTVVVSLGNAVYAKNFVGKSYNEVSSWANKNGVSLLREEQYSNDYSVDDVISQSIEDGKIIKDDFKVVVSLGNPKLPQDLNTMSYADLKMWLSEVNQKGADISKATKTFENSDTVAVGNVISIGGSTNYVKTGSTIYPVVSLGRNVFLKDITTPSSITWADIVGKSEADARALCGGQDETIACEFKYIQDPAATIGNVVSVKRADGSAPVAGTYISQSEAIIFEICEKN